MRLPEILYRKLLKKIAFPLLNRLLAEEGRLLYHYSTESDRLYPITTFNSDIYKYLRTDRLDTDSWSDLIGELPSGGTILDVGANVGFTSAWFSPVADRVHAFEPHPTNVDLLHEQLRIRRITNVEVHPTVLADREGTVDLHCKPRRGQHSLADVGAHPTLEVIEVPATTLDAFLGSKGIGDVRLLKVDVEGFEPEVFRGGRRALEEGSVPRIVFEFSPSLYRDRGIEATAPIDFLTDCGYNLFFPDWQSFDSSDARAATQCDVIGLAPGVSWDKLELT